MHLYQKPKPQEKTATPTNGAAYVLDTDTDRYLVARAISYTRVSRFTPEERDRLSLLIAKITGYRIEGGL